MHDVVFITPSSAASLEDECTGTLILARVLEKAHIAARILRFWDATSTYDNYPAFEEAMLDLVRAEQPRIVSFYTRCDTYHISISLAKHIKQNMPGVSIVFGGPQAHLTARASIEALPWLDFVCCGEGERTIAPLFSSIIAGKPDLSTPGLVYRAGEDVVANPLPEHSESGYRFDYHYYSFVPASIMDPARAIIVDGGRGCPHGCTFCSTKTFWLRHFRLRDPADVLDRIEYLVREHDKHSFSIDHDLFTAKRSSVIDFCDQIEARKLQFSWSCSSRVDTIDDELIMRMKQTGLSGVYLGVETGSKRMQRLIKKGLDVDRVVPLATFMHNEGISVTTSFIFGFPEETEDDFADTLRMILALADAGITKIQLHELGFMEGTELFEKYRDKLEFGIFSSDITKPFGLQENIHLVRENPQLFASFFGVPGALRESLRFSPDFVRCYKRAVKSMHYVVGLFNNDAVAAYYAFAEACRSQLEEIRQDDLFITYSTSQWIPLNLAMLDVFFESLRDAAAPEEYRGLCEIYRYEKNVLLMSRGEGEPKCVEEYLFDWYALRDREPLAQIAKRASTIRLRRKGSKEPLSSDGVRVFIKVLDRRELSCEECGQRFG